MLLKRRATADTFALKPLMRFDDAKRNLRQLVVQLNEEGEEVRFVRLRISRSSSSTRMSKLMSEAMIYLRLKVSLSLNLYPSPPLGRPFFVMKVRQWCWRLTQLQKP